MVLDVTLLNNDLSVHKRLTSVTIAEAQEAIMRRLKGQYYKDHEKICTGKLANSEIGMIEVMRGLRFGIGSNPSNSMASKFIIEKRQV